MTAEQTEYLQGLADEIADRVADRLEVRPLLTYTEAAERLNISESGLRNLIGAGRLATIRVGAGGGSVRIEQRAIDAYLAEQREANDGQ